MKKYALISVSDKSGIEILAIELENLGYSILSTSNTAKHLRKHCREVIEVSDLTGFPEILDGRVKTLHPVIHAGILAERGNPEHEKTLREMKIDRIDVVAVNLYPFSQTRVSPDASHDDIIENIDIGGPTLIRAAAKNYRDVVVLTDPKDYLPAIEHLRHSGMLTPDFSAHLAQKAFAMVSHYDANITDYFAGIQSVQQPQNEVPPFFDLSCSLDLPLRYGENPHQKAGFYVDKGQGWDILHGKNLSFNNLLDVDASLRAIRLFEEPTVVIIKHCNPCGIGSGFNLTDAYRKAFATDTISPFGGIVVVNRPLDLETAVNINRIFTEIIIAPEYETGVLDILKKKKDRRLVRYNPELLAQPINPVEIKTLVWGYLMQDWDLVNEPINALKVVTRRQPTQEEFAAMIFGWKVVAILRSNAIALTSKDAALGLGIGQTSRIDSTAFAILKAQKFEHDLNKAICASDGFFPYRDSIDELYRHGIKAVIQPGGSKADPEVIQACNELDMAMVFTGYRHFRH